MTSSSKTIAVLCLAALTACAAWWLSAHRANHHKIQHRIDAHARAETRASAVALLGSFRRALDDGELSMREYAAQGTPVLIGPNLLFIVLDDYKESQFDRVTGTNIFDNWGNPIQLTATILGYATNSAGVLQSRISVRALSFGVNCGDDAGEGDDILIEEEMIVPRAVLKGSTFPIVDRPSH